MTSAEVISPAPTPLAGDITVARTETHAELKRGAFQNTIAMMASNFRGVFTFLVARLLGPAALGTFSVAWANIDLISKISVFGLDNAVTTFIARSEANQEHDRSRARYLAAVILVLVQSFLVAIAGMVALHFLADRIAYPREMISALAFLLFALPGVGLYRVSTSVSRGMKVMKHDIFSRGMTEPLATTIAFLGALAMGSKEFAPETAAVIGTAASGLVALILAARLFRRTPGSGHASVLAEMKPLLAYAAPITAYQILNAFILRLDVIMLGWFIGRAPGVTLATVGIYGAVVNIAGGLRKVNQSFNPIFAPIVAGMTAAGEHKEAAAAYARIAQWMLWILLPAVTVMALSGSVILLIYGKAFEQGGTWLAIVAAGCATTAFVSLGETVILVQRPRLNLLNSIIACAIAVPVNLWLIPRYGVTGAAISILVPYVVQGILRSLVLRFVFHWHNDWKMLAPPMIATLIALLPALACRVFFSGMMGQLISGTVFLAGCGTVWLFYARAARPA
jgi:O-antigen/teichoic acid export membrane protein